MTDTLRPGFTNDDRTNLTNACRDVKWMRENQEKQEKRMNSMDEKRVEGERRLHERVDEVHSRVNRLKFIASGFALVGSGIGGFFGWITTKGGN